MWEKSNLYKGACLLLIMGAPAALTLLDALQRHGLLSRRTVAQYVMPALYGCRETRVGTTGYMEIEQPLFREVVDEMRGSRPRADADPSEEAVSNEAAMYLRGILEIATGDRRHGMICLGMRYDGFSRDAYEQVRRLLGRTGMRYLGIADRYESLEPSKSMVSAIVQDEESEGIPYSTARRGPLCGPHPFDDDPWEKVRKEMEQYDEWSQREDELDIDMAAVPGDFDDTPYQSVFAMDFSSNKPDE